MARIIVTGGAGFLGRRLISTILAAGRVALPGGRVVVAPQILCLDVGATRPADLEPAVDYRQTQIEDEAALAAILADGVDAVFHLAAVVSSAAEADFDLGMRVNLGGTLALFRALAQKGGFIPLVTTSSIATAGLDGAPPASSYGVQKAMTELLGYDMRRRGMADLRTIRLPTIVVRPGRPNAAASSFASSIIREPLAGEGAVCPVSADLAMWVASPDAAIRGMLHAMSVAAEDWPAEPAVNLPGLTVTVAEMVAALRAHAGDAAADRIVWTHDDRIDRIVASWPAALDTGTALSLGFTTDASYADIVAAHAASQQV